MNYPNKEEPVSSPVSSPVVPDTSTDLPNTESPSPTQPESVVSVEKSGESTKSELDDSISPGESERPMVQSAEDGIPETSTESLSSVIETESPEVDQPNVDKENEENEEMFIREGDTAEVADVPEIPQTSLTESKDEELLHEAELFRLKINKSGTLKKYFKVSEKNKAELRSKLIKNYMNVLRISTRKNLTDKHHKLIRNIRNTFNRRLNIMDKMRKRKTKTRSKK